MLEKIFPKPNYESDDLVLFYHSQSFYSQKLLLALYEKNIKFIKYEIDVTNSEQYSPWFLELNPKGEVPVLKNSTLVVPESAHIINYLERNFHGEKINPLLPKNLDAKTEQKVLYFSRALSRIPVGAISMGSFMHHQWSPRSRPPFIGPVRDSFLKSDEKMSAVLREYAEKNKSHGEFLTRKADYHDKRRAVISDQDEYLKLLSNVEKILAEVETELKSHQDDNWWLGCEHFTIADICLGILLYRLYCLGLDEYFWSNGKKIEVEKYFQRLSHRDTFQQSIPSTMSTWRTIWIKTPATYKLGIGIFSASSMILASYLIYKSL